MKTLASDFSARHTIATVRICVGVCIHATHTSHAYGYGCVRYSIVLFVPCICCRCCQLQLRSLSGIDPCNEQKDISRMFCVLECEWICRWRCVRCAYRCVCNDHLSAANFIDMFGQLPVDAKLFIYLIFIFERIGVFAFGHHTPRGIIYLNTEYTYTGNWQIRVTRMVFTIGQ